MRVQFDEQLELLNNELITLGSMCEKAIAASASAILSGNSSLAKSVPEIATEIDRKEREIEAMCIKLLLQQQPVATDLRTISAALKMVTDMERIGNQAADIAEVVLLDNIVKGSEKFGIDEMAEATRRMVTESIDSFVKKDMSIAENVIKYDDVVDNHFNMVKTGVIGIFGDKNTDGEYALDLLMVSKYLERIGDHAVKIAEWVIFSITGRLAGSEK